MPNWDYEQDAFHRFGGIIVGVDEVGRGPLAGPVVAAAVALSIKEMPPDLLSQLDDSKKLSRKKRETVFHRLSHCSAVVTALGVASVEDVDRLNILQASHLAMQRERWITWV